jgi:hypothetical protein
MSYTPPPAPVTTTRIDREVLDEIKRRFPAETGAESLRLALAALDAPKPAEAVSGAPEPTLEDDAEDERPVIELQPAPVLKIEGDGERDQDPVQRGCPACERGSVRRGAPHIGCGNEHLNPPNVGDRDRWG